MKFYLAGRYSRREELLHKSEQLKEIGHECTARWLLGLHDTTSQRTSALDDVEDMLKSDTLIFFAEKEATPRGGRHVEFGIMLALHMSIHVIGPKENVFHYLQEVMHYSTWEEFIYTIGGSMKTRYEERVEERPRKGHLRFYQLVKEIADLHERKNQNYGAEEDPLSNFKMCRLLGVSPFTGILVRMSDKWARIQALAKGKPDLVGESIVDTLKDLSVYSLLAIILYEELLQDESKIIDS